MPVHRKKQLDELSEGIHDVLIIGLGITGAGTLLDATSRGYKAVGLDKGDYASGTSSNSTKLIHAGIRYLKQGHFGIVRKTGLERAIISKNASYLAQDLEVYIPTSRLGEFPKWKLNMAMWVFKVLVGSKIHKVLSQSAVRQLFPLYELKGLNGAISYHEKITNDARLVLSNILTAKQNGAQAMNYCQVEEINFVDGHYVVLVKDRLSDEAITVKAKYIINATGPWADVIGHTIGSKRKKLKTSKGVHLLIPRISFNIEKAIYFENEDGRMIFAIPKYDKVYVGTTDTFYDGSPDDILCKMVDVEYLLKAIKFAFPDSKVEVKDVKSSWVGLRPLVVSKSEKASEVSRKDEVFISSKGVITIVGGKLTGYRLMAEKVLNAMELKFKLKKTKSKTKNLPLYGNIYPGFTKAKNTICGKYPAEGCLHLEWLIDTYGGLHEEVMSRNEATVIQKGLGFSLEYEDCFTLEDFLFRRSGLLHFFPEWVEEEKSGILEVFAKHEDWDEVRKAKEAERIEDLLLSVKRFN